MVLICCCCCLLYPGCVLDWTYVSGQSGNASSGNLDHQKRPQRAEVHGASLPYLCLFAHATLLHVVLLSYLFHRSCKGQKIHVKNWLTEGSVKSQLLGHSPWMFGGCHNFVMTVLVNSIVLVWAMCVCVGGNVNSIVLVWAMCVCVGGNVLSNILMFGCPVFCLGAFPEALSDGHNMVFPRA